jgi:biotin carboxyl carrier protein
VKLKIAGRIHDVARKGEGSFEVDGAKVEASASSSAGSRADGRKDGRPVRIFVARDGDRVFAQIDGRSYAAMVVSRTAAAATGDHAAQGGLEAPMPGRVTRVAVKAGDPVKRGQELVVVEAMKMENAIVAPSDGVVKKVAVKVGDMVSPGVPLIEVA